MKKLTTFLGELSEQSPLSYGFTLIELLVVFTFIGVLTSLGIAAYSSYNGAQSVQTSASDFATLLNNAKSHAISQVIPSACGSNSLSGYEIDVIPAGQQYTLYAVCGSKIQISTAMLPYQVTFAGSSSPSVSFNIADGTVTNPATIKINGFGKTKTVVISQTGSVEVQ
ncbi:MAG TPA: GspH/FimT family pseudopilin [Candidatus Acidoferrales bacterium]|nr:GspH/FimT family pseudopilin [Candidatus Acidoferrales bacterium]